MVKPYAASDGNHSLGAGESLNSRRYAYNS